MEKKESKKCPVLTIAGAGVALLVLVLTVVLGLAGVISGVKEAFGNFLGIFTTANALSFVCVGLLLFALLLLIVNLVFALKKNKELLIVNAACLFVAMLTLVLIFLVSFPQLEGGSLSIVSFYLLVVLMVLDIASIILLAKPLKHLYRCHKPCQDVKAGLNEKEVRQIVEQYLEEHQDEFHPIKEEPVREKEPEPVIEAYVEPAEEEPVEQVQQEQPASVNPFGADDEVIQPGEVVDEDEYEIVEVIDENGEKVKVKRKRKASFESRLKSSEFDIRHKYYDLRDYLKWYGLTNRVSLPGDTFSFKRKKLAFITIIGKRIRFYIALDPAKYEDSPIPVERAAAKKYADTPCMMKIKSDLSYRRAKKLIDDAMSEAGIARPEGDEPKETQHPEE